VKRRISLETSPMKKKMWVKFSGSITENNSKNGFDDNSKLFSSKAIDHFFSLFLRYKTIFSRHFWSIYENDFLLLVTVVRVV